jgi:chemotaxis protein methyltransferase CheR
MGVTPQLFSILSGIVEERAGLHYQLADREVFLQKVASRASEVGFDSLLDYYYFLRYDDPSGRELDALVDHLVVNETYFFRELEPLEVLLDEVIGPQLAAGRPARIWSAACSTGEEPLTLAMLLAERGWLDRVELVASDVSERVLARAQQGSFGRRAIRGTPPELASRWLSNGAGALRCDPRILAAVSWRRVNLLDGPAVTALGTFDAVVCRNVLIYFQDRVIERVVRHLSDALRPGGALLVGVAESLLRFGTPLECREQRGSFMYVKPAEIRGPAS